MRRKSYQGAAAAVVIILIIVLGLAGFWYYKNRGLGMGGSAFDLAAHLPKTSHAAFMLNLQGQVDPGNLKENWDKVLAAMPAERRKEIEDDLQQQLGMSMASFMDLFDGRAGGAILAAKPGEKPGFALLIGLRDPAAFQELYKARVTADAKQETVAGVSFVFDGEGAGFGHDQKWIYMADSKANAELLVGAAAGQETLSTLPTFTEAREKVAGGGSLSAFYWDIAGTLKAAEAMKLPSTDAQSYKELACLQYAVGSADLRGMQTGGFIKVVDDKTSLATKLLTKGSVNAASFGALTNATDMGYVLDVEWIYNSIVALMMVSPDSREAAGYASVGLAMVGNPFVAFEGELAMTNDGLAKLPGLFASSFSQARGQGQLVACQSNLKNIGTALEMYSTDWNGRYPSTLSTLTPNYLKTIPTCPAAASDTYSSTLKVTAEPDSFTVACSGNHHQQEAENLPAYDSNIGLTGGTPIPGTDEPEPTPSTVVTATVKDIKMAHALLLKAFPEAGAEPKPGEEKSYPFPYPGVTLKMTTGTPPRLVLGYGPEAAALMDTKGGTLADKARLKEALSWGGEGVIYADYLNLRPAVEALEKAVGSEKSSEADLARAMLEELNDVELEGASVVAVRPDGLHWRAFGSSGAMVVAGLGAAILVPNFVRAQDQGQLTGCKSNLKNMGTALEMYATDWSGRYPNSLDKLTPNYLKTIPDCPSAGTVTYRAHFGPKAKGNPEEYKDYYYVECAGSNHTTLGLAPDFPAYNALQGLIESAEALVP